jgi:hypothetical protein
MRRFPAPWTVEAIDAGFKVIDSNGQSLAYVYDHADKRDAETAKGLTLDEARRLASNIAKLPKLLRPKTLIARGGRGVLTVTARLQTFRPILFPPGLNHVCNRGFGAGLVIGASLGFLVAAIPANGQLLQLFDFPLGLVVDNVGRTAADRLVKFHESERNRSRDTFIFPRTTHQVVVLVVEGREYVVTIFVGFNAATVVVIYLSHLTLVVQAANRHVMERAFSFDIAGDSSFVNDGPGANSAIDFCHSVIYIVCVVFRLASLGKLRRYCWSRAKYKYDSARSEHRFHGGTPFLTKVELAILGQRCALK